MLVRNPERAPCASVAVVLLATGCAAPPHVDLVAWNEQRPSARLAGARGELGAELAEVERLRAKGELALARSLALALLAETRDDPRVLLAASRAESDGVHVFGEGNANARHHALAAARELAERAVAAAPRDAAARAQLAWALGATTHLEPMSARSAHAHRTLRAANEALELAPEEPSALATLAVLHLRLCTLPWIAKLMASDVPTASLEDAERHARRAVAARPSREHRQILAKVLVARDRRDEAAETLAAALAAAPTEPRDLALEPALRAELSLLRRK